MQILGRPLLIVRELKWKAIFLVLLFGLLLFGIIIGDFVETWHNGATL